MKQYWQRIETRIDAMGIRERTMAFAIAALLVITAVNSFFLDPLLKEQKSASQQVMQDQQQIAALQAEIRTLVASRDIDPDGASRMRLHELKQQSTQLQEDLKGMQKGLVSPDKMASLLEDILKRNSRLQLVTLKTLPAAMLTEPSSGDDASGGKKPDASHPAKEGAAVAKEAVYKHGVEVVVQGSYLDLLAYLTELEAMPWQLFWANAKLDVVAYPKATMTLTLFTLSLDKKWLYI